jgi:predicted RecA/RadA family phage recombinase
MQNGDSVTLTAGMAVYISAAGVVKRARANSVNTIRVCGLVADVSIVAGATGSIQIGGAVSLPTAQWDAVVSGEVGGLSAGTYYLSAATAGFLTAAVPGSGNYICVLGDALSATVLNLRTQTPDGPIP